MLRWTNNLIFKAIYQLYKFFLRDKYGLGDWSVNTGALMLHKEDMAALEEFSKAGVR